MENMRNIIRIKDVPSNTIEEAITEKASGPLCISHLC